MCGLFVDKASIINTMAGRVSQSFARKNDMEREDAAEIVGPVVRALAVGPWAQASAGRGAGGTA